MGKNSNESEAAATWTRLHLMYGIQFFAHFRKDTDKLKNAQKEIITIIMDLERKTYQKKMEVLSMICL